ncbi:unnamed protein product [Ectocarpus sp. 4 AP-2014]
MDEPTMPFMYRSQQRSMLRRGEGRKHVSNRSNASCRCVFFAAVLLLLQLVGKGSAKSAGGAGGAHRHPTNPQRPPLLEAEAHGSLEATKEEKKRKECHSTLGRLSRVASFAVPDDATKQHRLHVPRITGLRRPDCLSGGSDCHLVRDVKMAVAGAMAGAIATAALFPIDTAKTLRQANPKAFKGTRDALAHICRTRGPWAIYTGIPTAVVGAMPSSALYFGTYEAVKTRLMRVAAKDFPAGPGGPREGEGGGGGGVHPAARAAAHAVAAACGNAASSLIFVPKEYVKQTLQASGMGAVGGARETAKEIVRRTVREKGVRGLYCGYWATLSRNVPSAIIRFSLYEEIKLFIGPARLMSAPPAYLLAGALAGACASGMTTPFDVLKTRVATGSLEGGKGFAKNMATIVADDGWKGLYAGFQPRVVMSGLFTAVGFGSFEAIKAVLGVSPLPPNEGTVASSSSSSAAAAAATARRR